MKLKIKNWIKNNKAIFVLLCVLLGFLILFFTFLIIRYNVGAAEWWTTHIARYYSIAIGAINKYIPFSMTELIIISVGVFCIVLLVLAIIHFVKKRGKKGIRNILIICTTVFGIVTLFEGVQGIAYGRDVLQLTSFEGRKQQSEYKPICSYFIDDYNNVARQLNFNEEGEIIAPYNIQELSRKLEKEYDKIQQNEYITAFSTYAKPMATSFLYREFWITGLTFLPLGEVNANYLMTESEKPFTIAHEMAHYKGISREQDAQLMALYITLHSNDPYIKYSGYTYSFSSLVTLLNYTGNKDDYNNELSRLDPKIFKNNDYCNKYWESHRSLMNFADWVNSLFLKANGQEEGTGSYIDVPIERDDKKDIAYYSPYQKLYFDIYDNRVK